MALPWLEQIKVALSSREGAALEEFAKQKSWVTLPAVEREELAHELSKEAARYLQIRGEQQASRLFELATSIAPVSPKIFMIQGMAYYERAFSDRKAPWAERAIERLSKAAQYSPSRGIEHLWLIKSQLLAYDLTKNDTLLEQARSLWLTLSPSRGDEKYESERHTIGGRLFFLLAKASEEPADFQQALILLKMALEGSKKDVQTQLDYAHCSLELSKVLGKQSLLQEAVLTFEKILDQESLDRNLLIKLADALNSIYLQTGTRHLGRKSIRAFERAFAIEAPNSNELDAYGSLILLLVELEENLSLKHLFRYLKERSTLEPRLKLLGFHGRWLKAQKEENAGALRSLERELLTLTEFHNDAHYWLLRGLVRLSLARYFRELSDLALACDHFQRGLMVDHDRPGLWLYLARSHLLACDLTGDIESAKKSLQLFAMAALCGRYSEQFWIDWALAFFHLADALGDRTYLSEAILRFEKALEMLSAESLPPNAKLLYYYGACFDFLGDLQREEECYEKAVQILESSLTIDPNYEEAKVALAAALTHLGETTSNLVHLQRSYAILMELKAADHEDDYIWNELGVCLLSMARMSVEDKASFVELDISPKETRELSAFAIDYLERSLRLGNQHTLYNLACAYILKGNLTRAQEYFLKALEIGVHPPVSDMLEDEWLEPLRAIPQVQECLQSLEKREPESENQEDDLSPS